MVAGVHVGDDECQDLFVSLQSEVLDTSESGGLTAVWHITSGKTGEDISVSLESLTELLSSGKQQKTGGDVV